MSRNPILYIAAVAAPLLFAAQYASAAGYLEAMGIGPSRLETVIYGEERPLVMGTSEEAYAANRRAHFVIK
ncbi:MAG: hypothetical protein P8Z69_01025 [Acidihalobacter sp.]